VFDAAALLTAILNDVQSLWIRHAFLDLHSLFAHDATQKINHWALVVVQIDALKYPRTDVQQGNKKPCSKAGVSGSVSPWPTFN
jgi:hypothetical protein